MAYKLLLAEARRGDAGGAGGEGGGRGSRGLRDRRRRDGTGVRGLTTRDEPNNTQHVPAKRGYGGEGGVSALAWPGQACCPACLVSGLTRASRRQGIVNGWIGETLLRVHKKQRVELAAGSHAQAGVQPLTPPHAHTPRNQLKQRGVGSPRAFRFSRPPFVTRGEGVGGGVGVGARSPPRMQVDQTTMGDVEMASGVARVDWQPRTQGELQGIHMGMDTPQYAFWTGAGRSASTPAPPPVGPPSSSQPQSTFARPSVPTTVALLPFSTPHRRAVPGAVPSADSHGWRAEGPDRDRASPVPYFAAPHPTTVGAQTTRALQTQLAPRTPLARQQVMPSASVAVSPGAGFWASGGAGGTTALGRNLSIIPEDDGARESEAVAMAGGRAGHGYEHGPGQGRGQGTDGDAFGAAFWKRRRMECGSAVRTWEAGERDTLARGSVHGRNYTADDRQDRHHQDPALLSPQASPVLDVHALEIVAAAAAANEIEDVARSVSSMSVSLPGSGSAMSQDSFSGKRGAEQMPGRGYRKVSSRAGRRVQVVVAQLTAGAADDTASDEHRAGSDTAAQEREEQQSGQGEEERPHRLVLPGHHRAPPRRAEREPLRRRHGVDPVIWGATGGEQVARVDKWRPGQQGAAEHPQCAGADLGHHERSRCFGVRAQPGAQGRHAGQGHAGTISGASEFRIYHLDGRGVGMSAWHGNVSHSDDERFCTH